MKMNDFAELDQADQTHLNRVGYSENRSECEGWADPDMTVVDPERPAPPVMSDAEFNKVFGPMSGWIKSAAEVKNTHSDYVAVALLSVASAVIGNTRWAVPWDGWEEPPIIWSMLVGDPSSGKSPALDALLDPIKDLDAELSLDFQKELSDWKDKEELARMWQARWKSDVKAAMAKGEQTPSKPEKANAGPAPIRKRIRITDVTTEKVAELLAATWRGLLLSRDELSGWLASMDRYSRGGDRPFWLEAFGGRNYTVDRKINPDPILIDHLSVAIVGGTQPDKLDSLLLQGENDGLLARFLTVLPDPVPLKRPDVSFDAETPKHVLWRLYRLQPLVDEHDQKRRRSMFFSKDAQFALQNFRVQCSEWECNAVGLLKGHIGKLPGLAVRVSLVLSLLDWAQSDGVEAPTTIGHDHFTRASALVGGHLRQHANRAYGCASVPPEVKAARRIAGIIQAEGLTEISTRNIQRRNLAGIQRAKEITPAINLLIDANWLTPLSGASRGRPRKTFAVNPTVWKAS